MIVAVAVSSGFRCEVRNALSQIGGDIQLCPANMNLLEEEQPVDASPAYLPLIEAVSGVKSVSPAIYKAGIVKVGESIQGVVIKGVETADTSALAVAIPRRLSEVGGISVGDKMLTYFVGEKIRVRNFNVTSIYDPQIETDDKLIVYANLSDMRRLNGWQESQASMLEVRMEQDFMSEEQIETATQEIGSIVYSHTFETDSPVYVSSTPSRYPQLFDWLNLLDFNVLFVLVLMMIVAGFNMISGLLITLFENISTIGVFKAMGM
jgi:lipoprotein-releasing system permease protein